MEQIQNHKLREEIEAINDDIEQIKDDLKSLGQSESERIRVRIYQLGNLNRMQHNYNNLYHNGLEPLVRQLQLGNSYESEFLILSRKLTNDINVDDGQQD